MDFKKLLRKPKHERRDALKFFNYDAQSSISSFNSYSSVYTCSTDLNDRTSFRIHGIEGKFNQVCLKAFAFTELKNATRNFRRDSLLGEGGFGHVYKGWIDEHTYTAAKPGSGMVIAIKRLKPESFQGGPVLSSLSWSIRIKVVIGAARGLSFLHNAKSQVIYRNFKGSNILLDAEFNSKLSDFGLAKAGPTGDRTHVSTRVIGTHGYAAPEYVATGHLTAKSDVYSFGVVMLELLSGRRAFDETIAGFDHNLVDWAKPYLGDKRRLFQIMDSKLEGQYPQKGAFMAATLALQCLNGEAKARPAMIDVLATLEQIATLARPATLAF
ncbi:hypothetical protein TSUD_240510 [Trifolium subterraneum]|uniref:Protein kinase domain-containing protein n=1 Tax=Trifolium subterraneum TaxID=3900 RepID=A0A2Z6P5Y2_TRISU|nr:hypothetical protein TSUD_240510 [Trifolium subterraneum]